MMRLRGLQAKFVAVISIAMLVMLTVIGLMWLRQTEMQQEVMRLSQDATRTLVFDRLRDRGEAQVVQAAELLANPIYYFDLDAIGATTRSMLHQADVSYVLVYDAKGNVIHDGSGDIPTFGQRMRDPLADEIVDASGLLVQSDKRLLDVSMPIKLGDQRLGGVRVGYSLERLRAEEAHVGQEMARVLEQIGNRHLTWIALLLLSLLILFAIVGVILERALVMPIARSRPATSRRKWNCRRARAATKSVRWSTPFRACPKASAGTIAR
jgi:hypothetical protein